ncbi:hypothetical protein EVAR_61385_1 [Eumeta japonica]|uniref:Uncharacterized protein n=1 Tax=Eumeta variegata TaxID=151549 RepID=A0A4C1Z911_EUMVA|nr:hypothetical protein EVAR_61385_1 [Eumeta japonica]
MVYCAFYQPTPLSINSLRSLFTHSLFIKCPMSFQENGKGLAAAEAQSFAMPFRLSGSDLKSPALTCARVLSEARSDRFNIDPSEELIGQFARDQKRTRCVKLDIVEAEVTTACQTVQEDRSFRLNKIDCLNKINPVMLSTEIKMRRRKN